eukprot:4191981-Lingulodinium_polyedra.AAC.1
MREPGPGEAAALQGGPQPRGATDGRAGAAAYDTGAAALEGALSCQDAAGRTAGSWHARDARRPRTQSR